MLEFMMPKQRFHKQLLKSIRLDDLESYYPRAGSYTREQEFQRHREMQVFTYTQVHYTMALPENPLKESDKLVAIDYPDDGDVVETDAVCATIDLEQIT